MLDLTPDAIAPGIDLRFAPAALEQVTLDQRELADRKAQSRAQSDPVFIFTLPMRWFGFAMKIKWIETQVLVGLDYPTDSPAAIDYAAEITTDPDRALKYEVDFLAHRDRQLGVVPKLDVVLRYGLCCLSVRSAGRAEEN